MKKLSALFAIFALIFSLSACQEAQPQEAEPDEPAEEETAAPAPQQGITAHYSWGDLLLEVSHVYDIHAGQKPDDEGLLRDYSVFICAPDAQVTILNAGTCSEETCGDGQADFTLNLIQRAGAGALSLSEDVVGQTMEASRFVGVDEAASGYRLLHFETVPPVDSGIPYDVNGNYTIESWEFPVPTGETFGLTGQDAVLYTAAAKAKATLMTQRMGVYSTDLMLPMVAVYGEYPGENGATNYVCGYGEQFFYDLGADPNQLEPSNSGGGDTVARLTLSADGQLTDVQETWDGADNTERIQELCGPLTDLAEQLNSADSHVQSRHLGPHKEEEALEAYLNFYFPGKPTDEAPEDAPGEA